jgi:branched-chain amino acid transport system ATP-binding protein
VIVDAVLAGIDRLRREDSLAFVLVEQHARLALGVTEQAIVLDRGVIVHAEPSETLLKTPERLGSLMGVGSRAKV